MPPRIPTYPVIHVNVAADGSAHVNVAGDHRDYPAGPIDTTREQIIGYAVEGAARLGRGVRMTTVDPAGQWRLAVFPSGEVEPLDPVAGHIPGALNRPFALNVGPDGRFKAAPQLRAEFEQLLAGRDPATVVHHCGSGVSAVPNLLAMEIAGFAPTGLYAGSWSEWCRDPRRPVEKG